MEIFPIGILGRGICRGIINVEDAVRALEAEELLKKRAAIGTLIISNIPVSPSVSIPSQVEVDRAKYAIIDFFNEHPEMRQMIRVKGSVQKEQV